MNPPSKSSHRLSGWLILIAAMTAVGPISIDMYLPAFPLMEREFAEQGVERTMASYLIGIALGQLFYGPISDRFGRKPPMYFGFALYVIGGLGCVFATSMTMLIVMRVFQALGACAALVIGRAIVRDRCQPEEAARAFSTLMMIISLGPIVAPTLGGWVVTVFGWRAVFVFQAVMGAVLLVAMHRMMTESRDPAHVVPLSLAQIARSYGGLLSDRQFLGYSLIAGFSIGTLFCFVSGSPMVMTDLYGLSPQQFGWMIGANGVAFMVASRANIVALRRRGPAELVARAVWAPLIISSMFALLAWWTSVPLWLSLLLQVAVFVSVALVTPHVAALALAGHGKEAGSASAMMGAVQSALSTAAGVAVGAFADLDLVVLTTMMAVFAAFLCLSYLWVRSAAPRSGVA